MADEIEDIASATQPESASQGDQIGRLEDLTSQATLQYSKKNYDAAAELYAHATELQAELNGEMSPKNADLLYAYGRCLYHVAVRKSDVLGSKVAGEKPSDKEKGKQGAPQKEASANSQGKPVPPRNGAVEGSSANGNKQEEEGKVDDTSRPYFQFTGDENFDESEEDEDAQGDENGDEDEQEDDEDDFANAFEVLDMARVLLLQQIEEDKIIAGESEKTEEPKNLRQMQERLADTYDLQAEISLEGERFPAAIVDLRSALEWKTRLFPPESSLLAETHYKLSLALEFSSISQPRNKKGEIDEGKEPIVDFDMREEAAKEMEAAIASCKLRISKETCLPNQEGSTQVPEASRDVEDVKEMVMEMAQRVRAASVLHNAPADMAI